MFELDMADVKPSLLSWIVVGLMAVTFIAVAKWALNRWTVPGLTELINSV
jgi:hypothetical protein